MADNIQIIGQRRSLETRSRILEEATRIFAQKGYDACSFRMIADAAKVNHAVISYHFGKKEELWEAVLNKLYDSQLLTASSFSFDKDKPIKESFREHMYLALSYYSKEPYLLRIIFQESLNQSPLFDKILPKFMEFKHYVELYLKNIQAHGILSDIPISDFYFLLSSIVTTRFVHPHKDEKKVDNYQVEDKVIRRYADSMVKLFFQKD